MASIVKLLSTLSKNICRTHHFRSLSRYLRNWKQTFSIFRGSWVTHQFRLLQILIVIWKGTLLPLAPCLCQVTLATVFVFIFNTPQYLFSSDTQLTRQYYFVQPTSRILFPNSLVCLSLVHISSSLCACVLICARKCVLSCVTRFNFKL